MICNLLQNLHIILILKSHLPQIIHLTRADCEFFWVCVLTITMINRDKGVHNNALHFEGLTMQYCTDTHHIFCNLKSMHSRLKNLSLINIAQNLAVFNPVWLNKTQSMLIQEQKQSTVNKQHCQCYSIQLQSPHIQIQIALYGNIPIRNFNLVTYNIHAHQFPVEILTGWYQTTI